jgi:hypothetical protein
VIRSGISVWMRTKFCCHCALLPKNASSSLVTPVKAGVHGVDPKHLRRDDKGTLFSRDHANASTLGIFHTAPVVRLPQGDVGGADFGRLFELDEAAANPVRPEFGGADLEVHVGPAARVSRPGFPLYAARIEGLGQSDFVKVDCTTSRCSRRSSYCGSGSLVRGRAIGPRELEQKPSTLSRGTEGSNPSPSTGESVANLTFGGASHR